MPRDYLIKNLKEGLDVIEALSSPEQVVFSQAQVATATGLSKNQVFRILVNLRDRGWVVEAPGGYRLGPSLIRLAENYRKSVPHRHREIDEEERAYLGE